MSGAKEAKIDFIILWREKFNEDLIEEMIETKVSHGTNGEPEDDDLKPILVQLMKQQNKLMEVQNKILEETKENVSSKITTIERSLETNLKSLEEIELQQKVNDSTVMKALDRIAKNQPGTLEREADIVKDAWRDQRQKKGTPAV